MTATHDHPRSGHPDDNFSEFAEELRLLAEAVLERVEPVLRRTAADGRTQWSSCAWCPVCAAAAVVRGEHHDVVAAIADHGTAIVTVLREALAGVPVEPVLPPDLDPDSPEYQAWLHHSFGHGADPAHSGGSMSSEAGEFARGAADSEADGDTAADAPRGRAAGTHTGASAALAGLIARFAAGAQGSREGARPAETDTPAHSGVAAGRREHETPGAGTTSGAESFGRGRGAARRTSDAAGEPVRDQGATRAGYVPINVTIKA